MYGCHSTLNLSFEDTIHQVTAALKQEGFGVVSDLDI